MSTGEALNYEIQKESKGKWITIDRSFAVSQAIMQAEEMESRPIRVVSMRTGKVIAEFSEHKEGK